jgi:hypothetical protein
MGLNSKANALVVKRKRREKNVRYLFIEATCP